MKFKNSISFLLLGASLLLTASPAAADMRESIADTITNMVTDLSCDSNDQCKVIGFGDKPCGGFQSYKVYSTKTVNDETITKMVNSYNALDKENNLKNNIVSNCMMLMQPSVSCVQGQCTSAPENATIQ